jgi:hypothetical protein
MSQTKTAWENYSSQRRIRRWKVEFFALRKRFLFSHHKPAETTERERGPTRASMIRPRLVRALGRRNMKWTFYPKTRGETAGATNGAVSGGTAWGRRR